MGMNIKHYEHHTYRLYEDDLQRILFEYFKVQTGNHSKIKILDNYNGNVIKFPIHVEYNELLEHDCRVGMGLTPAKEAE